MNAKILAGTLGTILLAAPLTFAQDEKTTGSDRAAAEAHRQGRVALKPLADSPSQSMHQAISFERYKEMAAERQARKEGRSSNADRTMNPSKPANPKQ
jgi:hypothetical protein